MISSSLSNSTDSVSMKHIRKNFNNGRKLSIDVEAGMDSSFVSLASKTPASDRLKDLVASTWQGMRSGFSPTLCEAGVGGTYFMKDSHNKRIGVFKPNDEEMGCLNNPKGFTPMSASSYTDSSKNRGVVGGEAAFRECAAFVLDHENFSGVPATDLVACNYPGFSNSPGALLPEENIKIGSFQEFKEHDFDAEDISPVKASRFPVSEVHKIAILDIRLFNTDRHGGNILVRRVYSPLMRKYGEDDFDSPRPRSGYNSDADENGAHIDMQFRLDIESDEEDMSSLSSSVSSLADEDEEVSSFELIPIDHGYTLPHTVSGLTDSWFEWLNWPQSKSPFTQETKKYIERLDAERDVTLLNQKFGDLFPSDCYKVLRITTMWLKKGAQLNLSPYDIGVRMCRRQFDTPSDLEKMCRAAEEAVPQTLPCEGKDAADALFYVKLAEEMDKKLKEVAKAPTPAPAAANHHHHNHIRKLW